MDCGNTVRHTQLTDMLRAAEKAQSQRLKNSLRSFQASRLPPTREPTTPGPRHAKTLEQENENSTPPKTLPVRDPHELRAEAIPLTLDEIEWLDEVVGQYNHSAVAGVMSRLIDWTNGEPPEVKKKLFLVIRCRRCSAGAKGGVKRDRDVELSSQQWQWLENVRARCKHASIGKTLRIIVDFYMPLCIDDAAFEQKVLQRGSTIKRERHDDAVKSVDPARALAIR